MFNAQDFAARLSTQQDRWSLLKDFIAEWHGPLEDGDGYSAAELDAAEQRIGLKLPEALREWYQLAGQREDVVATQNHLMRPQDLNIVDGLLVFHSENQDVVEWGIKPDDLHLPDPPVYLNDSGRHDEPQALIQENKTLSEFALQMVVCDTMITQDRTISVRQARDEIVARIEHEYIQFNFPEWQWLGGSHFYGTDDTLAFLVGDAPRDIWVAARTAAAYRTAKELLDLTAEELRFA